MFEIHKSDSLSPEERDTLFGWSDDIWDVRRLGIDWRSSVARFVGREDGRPVSHAGVVSHPVELAGRSFLLGGIGAVVCVPGARGRGYASRTVEAATAFLRDGWSCDAGLLFCFPRLVSFYERLGWAVHPHPVFVLQTAGRRQVPEQRIMVRPFTHVPWPDGPVDLYSRPW